MQQFVTDTEEKFSRTVTLTNDHNRTLLWIASDSGYYQKSGDLNYAIDAGAQTILLNPEGSLRIAGFFPKVLFSNRKRNFTLRDEDS